jgi:drug/metabolite transporter (DMT)-like permease
VSTRIAEKTPTSNPESQIPNPIFDTRLLLLLLVMVTLWASAFPAITVALRHYSPEHVALLRYLVSSVVLGGVALAGRWRLPPLRDWPAITLMGLLGFTIYNIALNKGQALTTAGVSSFIVNTAPVFMVIFAAIFLRERLRPLGWVGILVSFCGVALLALAKDAQTGSFQLNRGAALILLSALVAGGYTILQKQYSLRYRPLILVSCCIWAGTVFMLPFAGGLLHEIQHAPLSTTGIIIYMGLFPTAIAYAIWAHVLSRIPASRAASFIYLVPVLATAMAHLWLGEKLAPRALLGGVLALLGVVVVNTLGRVKTTQKQL